MVFDVVGEKRAQNREAGCRVCCRVVGPKIVTLYVIVSVSDLLQSGECNAPSRFRSSCGLFCQY